MLLNFAWLIPGLPLIASVFIAVLLLSFSKTMNRLTKPISYLLIASLTFSEIINLLLYKENISGNESLLGSSFVLSVDKQALLFAESLGLLFLFIMLFSVAKLERRNGYVRYFVLLGLLSGFSYLFSFSGSLFHNFFDPSISSLSKIGISF